MSEAYTRVLQAHVGSFHVYSFIHYFLVDTNSCAHQIAIDTAIFPEGTFGHQLDVLARKALWKDGYMVRYEFSLSTPLMLCCFGSMVRVMVSVLS
jgi:hypothetical protein